MESRLEWELLSGASATMGRCGGKAGIGHVRHEHEVNETFEAPHLDAMEFLRLPSALRRAVIQHPQILRRLISTTTANDGAYNPFQAPPPTSQPQTDNAPQHQRPPQADEPATNSIDTPLLKLTSTTLNHYTHLKPPTALQLRQSNAFFQRHDPTLLYTAARFLELPSSPYPEICVLGRSNVGKSSLLNALFGRPRLNIAHVSKKPGKTRTINGYGVGGNGAIGNNIKKRKRDGQPSTPPTPLWKSFGRDGIIVVDMPGYGGGSQEDWGKEIMKYVENRKQLRRTYVLVDADHGLKKSDILLLTHFRQHGIPYQIVLSKVDKLLFPKPKSPSPEKLSSSLLELGNVKRKVQEVLNKEALELSLRGDVVEDLLCCSGNPDKVMDGMGRKRMIGVDELRWNMLTACGMEESKKLELGRKMKAKMQAEEKGESNAWRVAGLGDDLDGGWDDHGGGGGKW